MTRQELLTVLRHGSHVHDLDLDVIMDAAADEIELLRTPPTWLCPECYGQFIRARAAEAAERSE